MESVALRPEIIIDPKAKTCPGVARGIQLAENNLASGKKLYTVGQLIHNEREVTRLEKRGLKVVDPDYLKNNENSEEFKSRGFLIRCHGESRELTGLAKEHKMKIFDATCPIVQHSQKIVKEHVREGYRVLIAGKKDHAEVASLMDFAGPSGRVIADKNDIETLDPENRTVLIAQTTINPDKLKNIQEVIRDKVTGVKIIDTTCRFISNRRTDIIKFGQQYEAVILIGGSKSSNCQLLFECIQQVNTNCQKVSGPQEVDLDRLKNVKTIGITGGASTPHWQLEEMKKFLEEIIAENNPTRVNHRKGGKRKWRIWKNQNKTV